MLTLYIGLLILALAVILAGAELFTNSLEHLGSRFGLSEGLVGSVFAAVATALPETVVPIIAVFFGGTDQATREGIGVGAILGSPLMLITLALAIIGLVTGMQRGWSKPLKPEMSGLMRDLGYFLVAWLIAFIGLYVPRSQPGIHAMAGFSLVFLYIYYVYNTVRASAALVKDGHGTSAEFPLHLKHLGIPHTLSWELAQLAVGLACIIGGAKLFVTGVEHVAALTGIGVLLLSLIIIPIATEMPEKFNSVLWVRRGKDTLAFGNVTGALVFQGTLLPAFGMQLGSWQPDRDVVWAMGLTFGAGVWVLLLAIKRRLTPLGLMLNGAAYLVFLGLILSR